MALMLWPAMASAHSYKLGSIAVGHAWALPSQQTDAQVFMPMLNMGKTADELVAARSDVASLIELRKNNRYDDPPENSFVLQQNKPFPMRPTANHLRLIGLTKSLKVGDQIRLVLDFLNAGEIEIVVHVNERAGE